MPAIDGVADLACEREDVRKPFVRQEQHSVIVGHDVIARTDGVGTDSRQAQGIRPARIESEWPDWEAAQAEDRQSDRGDLARVTVKPPMTIPASPADFVSRALRSPTQASSRRPALSTTRTPPGVASPSASRKMSTLPTRWMRRTRPLARPPGTSARSDAGAQRTGMPVRRQASARCGVVNSLT